MKITFEGHDIADIIDQVSIFIADVVLKVREYPADPEPAVAAAEAELRAPWPAQKVKPQGPGLRAPKVIPEVSPTKTSATRKPRTPRQLANDARLREAVLAKMAAKKAAKEAGPVMPPSPPPLATAESLGLAPDEVVNLRNKTITDLQEAYANGHQQEVFELLSRFGNGAKSFRELPPESFVPIREAIDNGALT